MDIERLRVKVNPAHTALVIVDMQRDYCCEGGILDKMGFCLDAPKALVPRLKAFLGQARKAVNSIVHLRMTLIPSLRSPAMQEQYERVGLARMRDPSYSDFYEIVPVEGEIVIPKYRYSGFVSTYLDQYLRAKGVKTLVMTGLATNVCVESTIRDGFMIGYGIVVPQDMTEGTSPEAKEWSLKTIDRFFGEVVDSKDVLTCWGVEEQ
jgi:ureidoacrylate peracid hydrolase